MNQRCTVPKILQVLYTDWHQILPKFYSVPVYLMAAMINIGRDY
jgi:hypothetical protein